MRLSFDLNGFIEHFAGRCGAVVSMALPALLLGATICVAQSGSTGSDCGEPDDCVPDAALNSLGEETPFLWRGDAISDPNSNVSDRIRADYLSAIQKFPTAASCVVGRVAKDFDFFGAKIRWNEVLSKTEAEVCLFKVLEKINSTAGVKNLLLGAGFSEWHERTGDAVFRPNILQGNDGLEFDATWNTQINGPLYGGFSSKLRQRIFSNSFTIYGAMTIDGSILSISISGNPKLAK